MMTLSLVQDVRELFDAQTPAKEDARAGQTVLAKTISSRRLVSPIRGV